MIPHEIMDQQIVTVFFTKVVVSHYVVDSLIIAGGILGILGLLYSACAAWNEPTQMILRRILVGIANGVLGTSVWMVVIVLSPVFNHIGTYALVFFGIMMFIFLFGAGWELIFYYGESEYLKSFGFNLLFFVMSAVFVIIIICILFQIPRSQAILLGVFFSLGSLGCIHLSHVALKFSGPHFIIIIIAGFGVLNIMFTVLLIPVLDLLNVRIV